MCYHPTAPERDAAMILHVDFEHFASTVARLLESKEAFLYDQSGTIAVSAAHPDRKIIVGSTLRGDVLEVRGTLENAGFTVFEGEWGESGEWPSDRMVEEPVYVAAIAYHSREKTPGLWVDAFPALPSTATALRAFYDELESNGEIAEVSFEEFVRAANPNVVILGPNEMRNYLKEKNGC